MGLFGRKRDITPAEVNPELAALTGDYRLDPMHTTLGFVARHAMVTNVKGAFQDFEGTLHLDAAAPEQSTVSVDVRVASIDTGVGDRDTHLRSADFFDIEKYPTMSFRSTKATTVGGDTYQVTGNLTIKDVTRPVTIGMEFNGAATDPTGNERVGFEGTTEILRSDWGLTWNAPLKTGGNLVSDKIKLTFDISAIKQSPAD